MMTTIVMNTAIAEGTSSAIEAITLCKNHCPAIAETTISEKEFFPISAIVVAAIAEIATIAEEWFPGDRYDR